MSEQADVGAALDEVVAAEVMAAAMVRHQRIPMYAHIRSAQRCSGCDILLGATDGPNSPRHVQHQAEVAAKALAAALRGGTP